METTEKKVSHTPGPWDINPVRNSFEPYKLIIFAQNQDRVAICYKESNDVYVPKDEAEANAKLIAAAPELLEALKDAYMELYAGNARTLEDAIDRMHPNADPFEKRLVAVIKKATE